MLAVTLQPTVSIGVVLSNHYAALLNTTIIYYLVPTLWLGDSTYSLYGWWVYI